MDAQTTLSFDALLGRLKAASEATRLRLLALLSHGELTVSDLTSILGQSQPRISRHLKLLCDSGIIERFPEGAWVYYRLVDTGAGAKLIGSLVANLDPGDRQLMRDRERLEQIRRSHADMANQYFDTHAADWDAVRARHVPEAAVEEAMVALLENRTFSNHLDVGTGTGRVIELFASQVGRSVGIDANPRMLSVARNKLTTTGTPVQIRQADVYNLAPQLNAPGEGFDLVTIHQVLHFLDDPALALSEVARMTAPGGQLMIVDFAPHNVEIMRDEYAHRRLGFGDDQMLGWLENVGFDPEQIKNLEPETVSGEELTVKIWTAVKK